MGFFHNFSTFAVKLLIAVMNILILEDHPILLKAIFGIVSENFNANDIFSYDSPKKALTEINSKNIDLMLVDLEYANKECGINYVTEIRKIDPCVRIIAYTSHKIFQILNGLKGHGFNGYVSKEASDTELIETINKVMKLSSDEFFESDSYKKYMFNHQYIEEKYFCSEYETLKSLTKAEIKAIDIITRKKDISNKELADDLGVKTTTVKKHLSNIYHKIKVSSKEGIALFFRHLNENS